MSEGFKKSASYSDGWYTPKFIIDGLGKFDLDPCAPSVPLFKTAEIMYNEFDDGLTQKWEGRVWLNPPYSRPLINKFMRRMADHKPRDGINILEDRHRTVSHGSVQQGNRR